MSESDSIWEAVFNNVPDWYSQERVVEAFDKHARTAREYYERQGFTILQAHQPVKTPDALQEIYCSPGATRYVVWLLMTRKPREIHIEIPDAMALEVQEKTRLVLAE